MNRIACWGCLLLGVGLLGCSGAQSQETKPPPPPEVFFKLPLSVTVTDHEDFTGHTQAVKTVTVRARVQGYLVKVNFVDGAQVKKGDVLFEIDPRPYQDQLDNSLGQVASLEALHKQAAADNARFKDLAVKSPGAVTGQDLDKYEYADQQSAANLASAKATLQQNELNLSFTKVVADTDGRISNHMIDVGNLVLSDNTPLTTIVTQDPVWAYFDIDEHTWLRIDRIDKQKKAAIGRENIRRKSILAWSMKSIRKAPTVSSSGICQFRRQSSRQCRPARFACAASSQMRAACSRRACSSASGCRSAIRTRRRSFPSGLCNQIKDDDSST